MSNNTLRSEEKNEKYEVRPGTIDRGKEYEYLLIAHLALSLVLDDKVIDFRISSNDKRFAVSKDKFCAFDDVVVEIEKSNKTEKFAIQLKYTNTKKLLTKQSLAGTKGDFAISKYLKDYLNFRELLHEFDLVIFTNYKFDNNDEQIRLIEEEVDIKISRKDHQSFLKNYPNEELCYNFEIVDNMHVQNENYRNFLNKFFLHANQADADTLEDMILKKFQEEFQSSKDVSLQYIDFIKKWNNRQGKKEKLSKSFLQQAIALLILSPYIQPFSSNEKDKNYYSDIFVKTFFTFNVTFFDKQHADIIKQVYVYDAYAISDNEKMKLKKQYHICTNEAEINITL